jgi:hypothetical protein
MMVSSIADVSARHSAVARAEVWRVAAARGRLDDHFLRVRPELEGHTRLRVDFVGATRGAPASWRHGRVKQARQLSRHLYRVGGRLTTRSTRRRLNGSSSGSSGGGGPLASRCISQRITTRADGKQA